MNTTYKYKYKIISIKDGQAYKSINTYKSVSEALKEASKKKILGVINILPVR